MRAPAPRPPATIYLSLTTEEIEPGVVGGGSRLDDVKDVLAWEAIAALRARRRRPVPILGFLVCLTIRLRAPSSARLLEQN